MTFSGFLLFLLRALSISAYRPFNLKNIIQLSTLHFPVMWKERNSPWKGSPALPIRKSATCDQRASTFLMAAGVNPAQLVQSLQGLYFWELKRQPVWGPFSSPTEPFVTGNIRPPGIFQCSSNCGACTMHLTLFKDRGCTAPGREWRNTENYIFLQAFSLGFMERLLCLSTKTHIISPFFLFTPVN